MPEQNGGEAGGHSTSSPGNGTPGTDPGSNSYSGGDGFDDELYATPDDLLSAQESENQESEQGPEQEEQFTQEIKLEYDTPESMRGDEEKPKSEKDDSGDPEDTEDTQDDEEDGEDTGEEDGESDESDFERDENGLIAGKYKTGAEVLKALKSAQQKISEQGESSSKLHELVSKLSGQSATNTAKENQDRRLNFLRDLHDRGDIAILDLMRTVSADEKRFDSMCDDISSKVYPVVDENYSDKVLTKEVRQERQRLLREDPKISKKLVGLSMYDVGFNETVIRETIQDAVEAATDKAIARNASGMIADAGVKGRRNGKKMATRKNRMGHQSSSPVDRKKGGSDNGLAQILSDMENAKT